MHGVRLQGEHRIARLPVADSVLRCAALAFADFLNGNYAVDESFAVFAVRALALGADASGGLGHEVSGCWIASAIATARRACANCGGSSFPRLAARRRI